MPKIINGYLHSPFFIFVECGNRYEDTELMELLGVRGYTPCSEPVTYGRYLHIACDSRWMHVADDWLYSLWHSDAVQQRIPVLARKHNVFSCAVGDADHSFEFSYYLDATLRRRYVFEDPNYDGGHEAVDHGEPLPGEKEALGNPDEFSRIMVLAASLGVDTDYTKLQIRTYTRPYESGQ